MIAMKIKEYIVGRVIRHSNFFMGVTAFFLGAVASFIFPPFVSNKIAYCALIAFLVLLFSVRQSRKKLFWIAYAFGFSFYAVSFAWICNALLIDEQKFVAFVPFVFFAFGAFFALFWALPALFLNGKRLYSSVVSFCCIFVVLEWVRSFIFTGFPWNLLGTALSFDVHLIQGAAYIGTYGLSLLLLALLSGVALLIKGIFSRSFQLRALMLIFVPLCVLGGFSLNYKDISKGDFIVRLVQPSIPQTFKWNQDLLEQNFQQYIDLTKSKSLDNVQMVVWGETATPFFLDRDEAHLQRILSAIPDNGILVTGVMRVGMENGAFVPYNSMYAINKKGHILDYYDKSHLVPFGEYLPLRDYLPDFMEPVANVVGDLGKGEKFKNISIPNYPLMGGSICYEVIFPKGVVNPTQKPQILLVLANDGWYGISSGPYQHLVAAQMRAVEEGITVVRSANTGISAVISPNGNIYGRIELNQLGISDVALPQILSVDTPYNRFGNIIPLALIGVLLLLVLMVSRRS